MKNPVTKRFYRDWYLEKFVEFYVKYKHTDLWIGFDGFTGNVVEVVDFVYEQVKMLHDKLSEFIKIVPSFATSLVPICMENNDDLPEFVKRMLSASWLANVGPMACVAGTFAQIIGDQLIEKYNCTNVIVENGGDVYISADKETKVGIFANFGNEFNKISLVLGPGKYGVCTSSGKIGHSLNFGKADAVTVVSKNVSIADAFATKYSNMVKSSEDVEKVLNEAQKAIGTMIEGVVVIYQNNLGAVGNLKFSY